jgi:hypothetical protein
LKMMFDGTIVEKFPLQEPHQVCRTEGNRLAITCWDTNRLVILDTEPNCSIIPVFCKIDIPFPDLSGRKLRQ